MEDSQLELKLAEQQLDEQHQQYQHQLKVQSELDQQCSKEKDQCSKEEDLINQLIELSLQGGGTSQQQEQHDKMIAIQMYSSAMKRQRDRLAKSSEEARRKEQELVDEKNKAMEKRDKLAANVMITEERYRLAVEAKEQQLLIHQQQMALQQQQQMAIQQRQQRLHLSLQLESDQPLPDYELANNDDELELTFTTQAEKKRHQKLERLVPAMEQKKSMKSGDKTPNLTQVIGDEYRAGYSKVTNETKKAIANKYSQRPIKESTRTPEEIELETICNETAQDIRSECPGYTGELLLSEAEIHLLARVSKGTEGHNNGESQEVSMLAVANRLKDEDYFGLPLVLHQNIKLGLGYYRHFPEKCDAIMQTIKAILYSKYKKIILMINDTLRAFYESVHYCYFLGVVKALNPNKEIEIISCANGIMPMVGLPYIIEAIHTREMKHRATNSQVSNVRAGSNVPFDSTASKQYQHEIIINGDKLYEMWRAEGVLPSFITDGRKRVVEELQDDPEIRKNFKDTVEELEGKLRKLNLDEPSLHNISITSNGSSIIIDDGSSTYFGPKSRVSSNDIAVVFRMSTKHNKVGGDEGVDDDDDGEDEIDEDDEEDDIAAGIIKDSSGHVFIDDLPIGQLAPIIAHINKLKLLDNGARLWIFFDHGCARTNPCNKEYSKMLGMMIKRKFRHIFMTTLNRINSNSVAVQTFLGAQEVSPGLEIHCSLEHGKSKITIAGNEHHRVMEKQESNDKCKASVTSIEQSFPEVTDNITLHNDAKTTSGYVLTKKFRKQVEDIHSRTTYPTSSFIPFSTLDAHVQKDLEILNEKIPLKVKEEEKRRLEEEKRRLEQVKQAAEERRLQLEQAVKQGTLVLITSNNTTGYMGVFESPRKDRGTGTHTVVYVAKYKSHYLGTFDSKKEAAMEYALAHFNATN